MVRPNFSTICQWRLLCGLYMHKRTTSTLPASRNRHLKRTVSLTAPRTSVIDSEKKRQGAVPWAADVSFPSCATPPPTALTPTTAKVIATDFSHTTPSGLLSAILDTLCVQTTEGGNETHFDNPLHRKALCQWLGLLSLQVAQYGPLGRFVSQRFLASSPDWQHGPQSEAYALPTRTLVEKFIEAAESASLHIDGGQNWKETKLLLARALYPVQVDRLLDTEIDDIGTRALFDVTPFEASFLPILATRLFRLIGAEGLPRPPSAARCYVDPFTPYRSMFFHLRRVADRLFREYANSLLEEEGNAPLSFLADRLRQREELRRLRIMGRHLESPTPDSRRNVKRAAQRLMPGLPQWKTLRTKTMSEKLERTLAAESRVYYETIGQKLLSLALFHELPALRACRAGYEELGNSQLQQALLRTAHFPPRATSIAEAFCINVMNRKSFISTWSPDAEWRLKIFAPRFSDRCLSSTDLPTFSEFREIIKRNVTCPPQAYLSYLAFCDSPETHSIQPWWNGEHKKNDPDIRWRLHDTLSPDAFVKELEYGDSPQRMPHTLCITREFLNALLVYFHHASLRYSLSETKKCVILIIGTSAGRLAWYLTALQQRGTTFPKPEYIAAAVTLQGAQSTLMDYSACKKGRFEQLRPYTFELTGATGFPIAVAGTLVEILDCIKPTIIVCSCMPTGVDWSEEFRRCNTAQEYVLLGPKDSDAGGHPFKTWGCSTFFHKPYLSQVSHFHIDIDEPPPYERDGFQRFDIPAVSLTMLGSLDTPDRVGTFYATAFRRHCNEYTSNNFTTVEHYASRR